MAKQGFKVIEGSITAPQGFTAAGVFCDIKRLGTGKGSQKGHKRDLGIIFSMVPAAVAGLYTTNQVCAAPVKVCAERTAKDRAQVIVANSGNANACTGRRGRRDAETMTWLAAQDLGVEVLDTLVCSTGRIGVQMPMENVKAGILAASRKLNASREAAADFAEAIMTSDSRAKEIAVELALGGRKVRIGGVCKGAGMIQPGMSPTGARPASSLHATMLGFVTTDAAINPKVLKRSLEIAVAQSFNRITVDGDMSTNDTVLMLANGMAGNKEITRANRDDLRKFEEALNFVCLELAKMIVRDGEGVSRFVTVRLHGAKDSDDAEAAARAVANSELVKTSWCGGDPNWGRILDALGYSSAMIIEDKIDVGYSRPGEKRIIFAVKRGQPTSVPFKSLVKLVAEKEFDLHMFLNLGSGHAVVYTCDLTEEYVDFNKGDVSDPAALGG
jgi:glutamate N-acetyltransferase/amino-acid N-acetyltransferase